MDILVILALYPYGIAFCKKFFSFFLLNSNSYFTSPLVLFFSICHLLISLSLHANLWPGEKRLHSPWLVSEMRCYVSADGVSWWRGRSEVVKFGFRLWKYAAGDQLVMRLAWSFDCVVHCYSSSRNAVFSKIKKLLFIWNLNCRRLRLAGIYEMGANLDLSLATNLPHQNMVMVLLTELMYVLPFSAVFCRYLKFSL